MQSLLVGFARERVQPTRVVTLSVKARTAPKQTTIMVDFLVVDRPSAYNAIVGRPTLNKLRAMTSTHHLKMKFPTDDGVKEVRGDQLVSRRCYNKTLKQPLRR